MVQIKFLWLLLLIVVAVIDFRLRKFFNIIFLLILFFGFFAFFIEANPFGVLISDGLISAVACFILFLIFYRFNLVAAGDVKFATVQGLWLGIGDGLLFSIIVSSLLAFIHAFIFIYLRNNISYFIYLDYILYKNNSEKIPLAGYMAVSSICWMLLSDAVK